MNASLFTLIIILWTAPGGYEVTGIINLTAQECREAAYDARGDTICMVQT